MKATKDHSTPVIVPNKVLKGRNGREPFADKIAEAKKVLEKAPLPDFIKKK